MKFIISISEITGKIEKLKIGHTYLIYFHVIKMMKMKIINNWIEFSFNIENEKVSVK